MGGVGGLGVWGGGAKHPSFRAPWSGGLALKMMCLGWVSNPVTVFKILPSTGKNQLTCTAFAGLHDVMLLWSRTVVLCLYATYIYLKPEIGDTPPLE